jgi:hypothetical protein
MQPEHTAARVAARKAKCGELLRHVAAEHSALLHRKQLIEHRLQENELVASAQQAEAEREREAARKALAEAEVRAAPPVACLSAAG